RGALERSLREIVRRHESLRTTFASAGGEPVQVISPPASVWPLEAIDLSALLRAEREARARALAEESASLPFDLARGPLLRTSLARLGEGEQGPGARMHPMASGGWGREFFVRELVPLYAASASGRPSPLPPLGLQYADFARWQRRSLAEGSPELEAQLAYWRS